ncbi:hypothetical protein [Ruminococcus sp.]|uniref:hypothetical protein n=1 Tax=Ruminococcus sp. TaxID=41978 RepID=UPI00386F5181
MIPFRFTFADAAMPPLVNPTALALIAVFVFFILPAIIGVIVLIVLKSRKRKTPVAAPPIPNTPYGMPAAGQPNQDQTDPREQNEQPRS